MAHITYITGGQRSGKSSYAQELALIRSKNPVYLATSRIWDEDHKKRIERHKADRGHEWENIEEEKAISAHNFESKTVLIDCITLWLTNLFYDNKSDVDKTLEEAKKELHDLFQQNAKFIIISNEIGMGGHAANEIMLKFTDLQGWINQYIAKQANEVYLMVSGLPLKVK